MNYADGIQEANLQDVKKLDAHNSSPSSSGPGLAVKEGIGLTGLAEYRRGRESRDWNRRRLCGSKQGNYSKPGV
jgi:hypothetical protein